MVFKYDMVATNDYVLGFTRIVNFTMYGWLWLTRMALGPLIGNSYE